MTDWSELQHAYGPADDVPVLLDRIASGDASAVSELANNIAHQGWASCAVGIAVAPRLWELGDRAQGKVKAGIARLLADLACMGSHEHFISGFGADDFADGMLNDGDYAALRAAVLAGCGDALDWLDSEEPAARAAAGQLIAVTAPEGATAAVEAAIADEKSRVTRSDLVVALGWLPEPNLELLKKALGKKAADRFGAAVALAMHGVVSQEIADALVAPKPMRGSVWWDGELNRHGVRVLAAASQRAGREDLLYAALGAVNDDDRDSVAASLLQITFAEQLADFRHGTPSLPTPALTDLKPQQRALLEELVKYDTGWGFSSCDQSFWLDHLGFWRNPIQLAEYLGIDPEPTVLDRVVESGRSAQTLREWFDVHLVEGANFLELATQVAEWLEPVESIEAAELSKRGPWPIRASRSFRICLMVAQGDSAVLRDRIDARIGQSRLTFWGPKHSRLIDATLEIDLFTSLKVLDPSCEWPEGLRRDETQWRAALDDPESKFGVLVAGWIRSAVR